MSSLGWQISHLHNSHDRSFFDCGENALNEYLQKLAGQHSKNNISRTFIATLKTNPQKILGFYTLSAGGIHFNSLPAEWQKKIPKYPIPIARIGRLAVDKATQKQGLGKYLLMDALYRCASLSKEMGILGVVVDAKDEQALKFYRKYGFTTLTDLPLTLFISIRDIIAAVTEKDHSSSQTIVLKSTTLETV